MGAPKQKWTAEEEAALKAGVIKHGPGKWRTILTDPEFSATLRLRSNVDLKDKWRNINVTAIWGSRQKAKLALKRNLPNAKHNNSVAITTVPQSDDEVLDTKPLPVSNEPLQIANSNEPVSRLDKVIIDAIRNLKEPSGSDRAAIASYIEMQYQAPPNLRKILSSKLKQMAASGRLVKVKHNYRIAPSTSFVEKRKGSSLLLQDGRTHESPKVEKTNINILTKSQIDAEILRVKGMTAQEAAAAAARAVAEAEAAIADAEAAAREAEAAEAEAEAAEVFAKAAMKALKCRTLNIW